jgi:hypothetical protein
MECRLLRRLRAVAVLERIAHLVRIRTRRLVPAVLFVVVAIAAASCETSSTISAGPDPVKCQVALASPPMMEAVGGNSSITVTTQPECAWTASTSASWISSLSPASGQGNGSVSFRVAANDGGSLREGTITINNEQARVSQRAPCRFTLTPASQTVATSGGASTVDVTTESDCAWTVTTETTWITVTGPASGTGPGVIGFTVPPNIGAERTGSIIVEGQRATVIQSAAVPQPNCDASIAPTEQNIGAAGGAGTIAVAMPAACAWSAVSSVPWITLTSASNGNGNGTITFTVAANTGAARTGTIAIANRVFTVSQAAGSATSPACTYLITPTSQDVAATATTGTVTVTSGAGCTWTATSGVTWITITSGASGTGGGPVGFSVAANTGAARSGTASIAGQTFTVNQAAAATACTYSIAPTSQDVAATATTGTVTVTAGAGCTWTATSGVTWITITSGASGTGGGPVGFSVAANTGAARSGTVTIAGQTFTVNQAAFVPACIYSLSSTSQSVPAAGGTGTVTVTTATGCTWTASSNAPWLTVTSGASGSGDGTVGFSAAANTGALRTGVLTIGSQTLTVTQAAAVVPLRSQSQ